MHLPTPEEILTACAKIRAGWTLDQHDARIANDHWRARHVVARTGRIPRRLRGISDRD